LLYFYSNPNTTLHEGGVSRMVMNASVQAALDAFAQGLPVCLFDSEKREGETDLLF
jgi:hypothetical protein